MPSPKLPDDGEPVPSVSQRISKWDPNLVRVPVVEDNFKEQSNSEFAEDEEKSVSGYIKTLLGKRKGPRRAPDAIATKRSVFDDPRFAPLYWPKKDYESIHRFDPSARWTYREEKVLLRKIDWRIVIMSALGTFAQNLSRSNIDQANSASFLTDLRLTTDDFNLGNSIFRLAFLCAELPSQLISKRIGPDRWMPAQICLWSLVSLGQFWLTDRTQFLTCRVLLGALQGGFLPNLALYTSYFYTTSELPVRMAFVMMSMNLCNMVASFLAYGILHLNGVAGKAGWRWLFFIEGLVTFTIGVVFFLTMPPSPTQTKTWLQPKGWFTDREEVIVVSKVLRDDPTKGDMHNREGLTIKRLWIAICDYDLWVMYVIGFMSALPSTPPLTYFTLLLRSAGFSTFETNLLTIPAQAMETVNILLLTLVSELVDERAIVATLDNLWVLPFLVALCTLPLKLNPWLFFGLITGLLSFPNSLPIQVGWCSRNSGAVASRTLNTCLYSMFVQASGIVAAQIYVASDAPRYERGNRILVIVCCVNIFLLYPGAKAYYIWRNRQRAKVWDVMTPEEKAQYLRTTKDIGNKRLDFRFVH